MAKNNKNYKEKNDTKNGSKTVPFKNPATRPWGKIIITILALAMCLGGLLSLVFLIVNNILH